MVSKSCVTIALVPAIKTGPWVFWDNLEESMHKAASLGFDAIELFTAGADSVDTGHLSRLLHKYNLELAAVGTGAGKVLHGLTLTDPGRAVREQARNFIADMMRFGAQFRAPAIIGSMQGNVVESVEPTQALSWLGEALTILDKEAGRLAVPLIYEPLNRYETNLINTLGAAAAFLDSHQTQNVKLLADLFHMNIEEQDLCKSIREYAAYIGHVHFADSNRRAVGSGHTPMVSVAKALRDISYRGFVSAEVFPWPSPDEAATRTIQAFRQFFSKQ